MDYRTLELNLAQLSKTIQKSKFNKYSDNRKKGYHDNLSKLFNALIQEDLTSLNPSQLIEKKKIIDFIFASIQYLDNSTLTIIPFEIVYCLEIVLNEWIPLNKFIVVTSLSNELLSYSFNSYLALNEPIYQLIENDYNIKFEYRLIQITLPRYYVHDYLANVVLYHELGHFIDLHFKISETTINNLILNGVIIISSREDLNAKYHHYMEYFADLFAAQYIGPASNYFLNYIAYKNPRSQSHPATDDRIELIRKFLSNISVTEIQHLNNTTTIRTGKSIEVRHEIIDPEIFNQLIPFEISNEKQLHSIFLTGWENWQNRRNFLVDKFDNDTAYKIINNLIEKSISNYIVTTNWNSI
ncbi:MAG: hypothetical protein K1X82_08675 [Bacteroidia bacterium]|nr:hypothetical protein [Bacteroidia bacterium]